MRIKIKKLSEDAVIPKYATEGSVAMDLVATSREVTDRYIQYGTGLAVEIPKGYVGFILPRSSIRNYDLALANSLGTIDSDFRGELLVCFKNAGLFNQMLLWLRAFLRSSQSIETTVYEIGDRIVQLIFLPYPQVVWEVVDELSETERGEGGFGSSDGS